MVISGASPSCGKSTVISGTQWHSVALSGTQWHSVALSGTQWYSEDSEGIDETHLRDEDSLQSRMQLGERRLGQA